METGSKSFLNPSMSLPFCPGCGQEKVVQALDRALAATGLPAERIVVVTDIGCSGLSDRNFDTNAFHGLHGRSITYSTGIKLADPDLLVVNLMGDGGCGIGGAHLVNAARRNIGIVVVVSNNFNFGMTGGEHSVTTPLGGITSTTPKGNIERPLDLCGLAAAAGGTFVARTSVFDDGVEDLMLDGMRHRGFAFIDVWNFCSAYYASRNRMTPKTLDLMLESSGLSKGVIRREQAPEYAAALRDRANAAAMSEQESGPVVGAFRSQLARETGIVIAGAAGQRIRTGASVLGEAAIASGLYATQKDDYPITVRTGHSVSEIILSPEEISYTAIESPDVVLILSAEGVAQVKQKIAAMKPGSLLILDSKAGEVEAPDGVEKRVMPFSDASRKVAKSSITVVAVAALAACRPLVPREALMASAGSHQDPKISAGNRDSAAEGFRLADGGAR